MTRKEYHITSIELEIYELTTYRKNLKKFLLLELRNGKMLARNFNRVLDELDRITIEIYELEKKKSEIYNLNHY
jgi:hypothetical protein